MYFWKSEWVSEWVSDCCLTPTLNNIPIIAVVSFIGGRNQRTPGKTTDLSEVSDKLYHIMLYISPWSRFELTTSVLIGTDCIGRCISNPHTIMTTTTPTSEKYSLYDTYITLYILKLCRHVEACDTMLLTVTDKILCQSISKYMHVTCQEICHIFLQYICFTVIVLMTRFQK